MLNQIIVIGRLTRDPELRYTGSGAAVCNFGIAVERGFKSKNEEQTADFFNVVCWRNLAETVAQHLGKGRLVAVKGRLQSRRYESNGQKRTAIEIVADSVDFLDYKDENGGQSGRNTQDGQEQQYRRDERQGQQYGGQSKYNDPQAEDDDLPFA